MDILGASQRFVSAAGLRNHARVAQVEEHLHPTLICIQCCSRRTMRMQTGMVWVSDLTWLLASFWSGCCD